MRIHADYFQTMRNRNIRAALVALEFPINRNLKIRKTRSPSRAKLGLYDSAIENLAG